MTFSEDVLKNEEKAMMRLRALYTRYGYAQYKMSKFEEYDLYVRNKSFLASEQIITFTDTSGKLLALKPDVTLSIVKNSKDSQLSLCKYFYNENVYRLSHTTSEFKERMQMGLECIGSIDVYSMSEVILLAEKSLQTISHKYVLDISHMGYVSALLDSMALPEDFRPPLLKCISEKNVPEIQKLCTAFGVNPDSCQKLTALAGLYGPFEETIGTLRELGGAATESAVQELLDVWHTVRSLGGGESIHLDFSIVNDMNYYNSIIFQGFVDGIPTGVLYGGRYDNLMQRFGKNSGAIGFAVYLDLLERFDAPKREYDVDVLLVYDETTEAQALAQAVRALTAEGRSVRALKGGAAQISCKTRYTMKNGRLEAGD